MTGPQPAPATPPTPPPVRINRPTRHLSQRVINGIVALGDACVVVLVSFVMMALLPVPAIPLLHVMCVIVFWLILSVGFGTYTAIASPAAVLSTVMLWLLAGAAVAVGMGWFVSDALVLQDILPFGAWVLVVALGLCLWRLWMVARYAMWQAAGRLTYRLAVIGDSSAARQFIATIDRGGDPAKIAVTRIYDDRPVSNIADIRFGGAIRALVADGAPGVDGIIIALPWRDATRITEISHRLCETVADVWLLPEPGGPADLLRGTHLVPGARVLPIAPAPLRGRRGILKRAEDIVLALLLLCLAAPVMVVSAIVIAFDSPGPVMIRQRRFGYGNVAFEVFKFRTMYFDPADLSGIRPTVKGDRRVTRVGRILRATSIDELPQLLNVLLGDMSIVGPRPHPVDMMVEGQYYHELVPLYLIRHRMKPGITGLAQINGYRGLVDTKEKALKRLEYDLIYIDAWSLGLDLKILLRTVIKEFAGSGAF